MPLQLWNQISTTLPTLVTDKCCTPLTQHVSIAHADLLTSALLFSISCGVEPEICTLASLPSSKLPGCMLITGCPSLTYICVLALQRASAEASDAAGSSSAFSVGSITLCRLPAQLLLDLHLSAASCTAGMTCQGNRAID
jgi:hypothetical protein